MSCLLNTTASSSPYSSSFLIGSTRSLFFMRDEHSLPSHIVGNRSGKFRAFWLHSRMVAREYEQQALVHLPGYLAQARVLDRQSRHCRWLGAVAPCRVTYTLSLISSRKPTDLALASICERTPSVLSLGTPCLREHFCAKVARGIDGYHISEETSLKTRGFRTASRFAASCCPSSFGSGFSLRDRWL